MRQSVKITMILYPWRSEMLIGTPLLEVFQIVAYWGSIHPKSHHIPA